jgi:hypothetical protein
VTPLYLIFYYQIRGGSGTECTAAAGATVQVYIGAGKLYLDNTYICRYLDTGDWTRAVFGLSAVAGQTANIVFHVEANDCLWNYLYLDDIVLEQTY